MLQLATSSTFGLSSLLRRPTWVAGAITLISCALFAAHGASSIVAQPVVPSSPHASVSVSVPTIKPRPDGELARRNMFCAFCSEGVANIHGAFQLPAAELIATSLGDDPRATVHVLANDVQGSFGIDDAIPGLGRVHRITRRWIEIAATDGALGRLTLDTSATVPGPGSAKLDPTVADNPFPDRLVPIDESTYEVDRALIREMFSGASPTVTGRLVPAMHDGKPVGVKVFGVKPGTIPFLLKLQNGDQLEAVNGQALTSADRMLALYASLDQLNVVEISITRRGKPITRTLRLR